MNSTTDSIPKAQSVPQLPSQQPNKPHFRKVSLSECEATFLDAILFDNHSNSGSHRSASALSLSSETTTLASTAVPELQAGEPCSTGVDQTTLDGPHAASLTASCPTLSNGLSRDILLNVPYNAFQEHAVSDAPSNKTPKVNAASNGPDNGSGGGGERDGGNLHQPLTDAAQDTVSCQPKQPTIVKHPKHYQLLLGVWHAFEKGILRHYSPSKTKDNNNSNNGGKATAETIIASYNDNNQPTPSSSANATKNKEDNGKSDKESDDNSDGNSIPSDKEIRGRRRRTKHRQPKASRLSAFENIMIQPEESDHNKLRRKPKKKRSLQRHTARISWCLTPDSADLIENDNFLKSILNKDGTLDTSHPSKVNNAGNDSLAQSQNANLLSQQALDESSALSLRNQKDLDSLSHSDTSDDSSTSSSSSWSDGEDEDGNIVDDEDSEGGNALAVRRSFDAWQVLKDEYAKEAGYDYTPSVRSSEFDDGNFDEDMDALEHHVFNILGTSADDVAAHPHVLSPPLMDSLLNFVPDKFSVGQQNFWLKYSLVRDGASLDTMLHYVRASENTIMAIETTKGDVFGCFTSSSWRKNIRLFGGQPSFVWKMRHGRDTKSYSLLEQAHLESLIDVFFLLGETEDNDGNVTYISPEVQFCNSRMIGIGEARVSSVREERGDHADNDSDGGGDTNMYSGFAIALESDLFSGTTNYCSAFRSPILVRSKDGTASKGSIGEQFDVLNLEVWTFTPCTTVEAAEKLEMTQYFVQESIRSASMRSSESSFRSRSSQLGYNDWTSSFSSQDQFYRRVGQDESDETALARDNWQYRNMMDGGGGTGLGGTQGHSTSRAFGITPRRG